MTEAPPTPMPTPALNYHPGYDAPADGWTVQSSDDVCFRIQPAQFGHWSSFFLDMGDMPKPEGEGDLLPFPVCSAALQFIVDAVKWIVENAEKNGTPLPEPKPMSFKGYKTLPPTFHGDVGAIEEVLYFSEAYDMAILVGPLYESLKRQRCDPSILFALSATTGFGNIAHWSAKLVHKGLQGMHPKAIHMLQEQSPAHLSLLTKLFREWDVNFAKFTHELHLIPYDSAQKEFPRRCKGSCAMSIKFNNSFLDFYQYIIPVATDYARRNPQFMGKDMFIRSCVGEAVDCQHCTTRIGGDINIAWTLCITHKCWALQFTNEELEAARIPGGYPVDVL